MKPFIVIILLVLCGQATMAQTTSEPSSATLQKCLLGTYVDTWTSMNLNSDQLERIRRVQQACREECEGAGAKTADDAISHADGSTVISEVKNILTADQYRAWVAYCAENSTGGKPRR